MLTEQEKKRINEHVACYQQRRSAVVEALLIVQQREGWVSDEAVRDVAEFLELSPDEVDGVATFYTMIFRRPVGRHVILLCDSVSCWIMGYEDVIAHLRGRLAIDFGQTTPDGRFTLLPAPCLGLCEQAPAMMIDHDVHGHLTVQKLDRILDRYS